MARLVRTVVEAVPYDVTQRGNRRQETFFSDAGYSAYLGLLSQWCDRCLTALRYIEAKLVQEYLHDDQMAQIIQNVKRGTPLGDRLRPQITAAKLRLESTLCPRDRPRKQPPKKRPQTLNSPHLTAGGRQHRLECVSIGVCDSLLEER